MAETATAATTAPAIREKGPSPFLRGVSNGRPTLALWAHGDDKKTAGHGYVVLNGEHKQVNVFFNDREGKKSISLSHFVEGQAEGEDGHWETLGYGNPVNSDSRNVPVYFDTVVFNLNGQTLSARTTRAADQSLRDRIGFTSPQVERPKKEAQQAATEAASDATIDDESVTEAERPRG